MDFGFIKLHRKIKNWDWIDDPNTFCLFLHLLINANFEDKKWRGINIKRGEFLTSLSKLSKITGLSTQQVRTALNKLKSTQEITIQSTKLNTFIKLTNYNLYQEKNIESNTPNNTEINKVVTDEQQSSNKVATTTKEIKEIKEDKKIIIPNFIDQILFDEFLQQRKKDKNPIEGLALKITLEDLEKWENKQNGSANLAIRNAIKGGWKSLIEPKNDWTGNKLEIEKNNQQQKTSPFAAKLNKELGLNLFFDSIYSQNILTLKCFNKAALDQVFSLDEVLKVKIRELCQSEYKCQPNIIC